MPLPADVAAAARADGAVQDALTARAVELATDLVDGGALRDADRWRDGVADAGPELLELQAAGVAQAEVYLAEVLEAQGVTAAAEAQLNVDGFSDLTDGGGSWLRNLLFAPPSVYRQALADGQAAAAARARFVAGAIAGDGVRDVARAARTVGMAARGISWYVRMLNGKSCARCAVLAGRRYRVSAFRRHPRCDCRNVPAAEGTSDWTTSPSTYFASLTADEQNALFTKAGAETIRLSGNVEVTMGQVVNAQAGMTVVNGLATTTTGTTSRGLAGQRLDGDLRLMPDEIFLLSESEGWDRAELLAQLQRYGYLL